MSFFQQTVVSQYLKQQDAAVIRRQWAIFQAIFHDAAKQQNIRNSKEEQYQEGFLRDLFVAVLGHTINPEPDWNLITEQKNQTDGKKADAAVHHGGKVIAVIELKGTDTTALDKIQAQAFGYKNNQSGCRYVVVSNFQKLRFYIDNAVEYLEWDLFALTEAQFGLLWLCLQRHNLESGLPARLKSETVSREEAITARLYRDYSAFKRELFADMVANNPQYGELELFKKSQKLLDRFLFILFAEDRHLLPANEINTIIGQWQQLKELDEDKPLYEKIKQYFNHLNTGHQAKRGEIFAYNGGLFKPDALLDSLIISDSVLLAHLTRLAEYDFNSDVDVNILGHIFENSLNEIDEIKARINGETIDKKQSKRKKDGVFYTPRYITRYIVDQTVGALCRAKKTELAIDDEDYAYTKPTAKNRPILEGRLKTLETYRDWLLQLTICDPACGSGAFLNEALNFLIAEHRYIDELSARLGGGELVYQNIENSILERNLYGVDINEESVEIAKLSLWLRTAQPHRKLSSLSSNIKCGNSLISDPAIAGEAAFDWEKEFPNVFKQLSPPDKSGNTASKQGFDVIIGNPPYGAKIQKQEQKFYLENYETPAYKLDSYSIFIEKSMDLVKQNGSVGLIVPYTCLTIEQHFKLRQFLLNYDFESIINLPQKVFTDADLDTIIIKINKCSPKKIIHLGSANGTEIISNESIIRYETISKNADYLINMYLSDNDVQLVDKLRSFPVLSEQFDVSQGLIPYDKYRGHSEETIKNRIWHADYKKDETYKKELKGVDISRYFIEWNGNLWVSYGDWLAAPREKKYFTSPRVLVMEITRGDFYKIKSVYTEEEFYNTPSILNIINKDLSSKNLKELSVILNSRLITWYHIKAHSKANAETSIPKILVKDLRNIPIPKNLEQLKGLADNLLGLNRQLYDTITRFQRLIQRRFKLDTLSGRLQSWHESDYAAFAAELKKALKKAKRPEDFGLKAELEWETVFEDEQEAVRAVQSEITAAEAATDRMVYALYGLTDEEIRLIEA